ncbi:MAG: hypothetical protein KF901_21535 [Myxococcales bacterium]|nr:hypothetical protein [Myxococcales bacterium]
MNAGAYRTAPEPVELVSHGLALALRGRCPFCAEVTASPGILSGQPCDVCGGAFRDDDRFGERVIEEMRALTRERFGTVLGVAVLVAALAGPFPFLAIAAQIVALVLFRLWVVGPCLALLAGRRRFVARWTLRLGTAFWLSVSGLLLVVPCASFVQTALLVGVVWWAGRAYLLAQLARERAGIPIALGEWLALFGVASAMLGGVALFLMLVTTIWNMYSGLLAWMGLA